MIGNQNYKCDDLNDLQSPENDIRQLGNLLEKLGFKVISLLDLTHGEMMQALEFFYEMLAIPAVYALFYYSGHGFSSPAGRNFLVPVDAAVPLRCDYNIDVETVTKQMRRKHSRAIVVLDCCRVESRYGALAGMIAYHFLAYSIWKPQCPSFKFGTVFFFFFFFFFFCRPCYPISLVASLSQAMCWCVIFLSSKLYYLFIYYFSVEANIPSGEFDSLPNSEAGSDTMSVANYVLITST